MQKIDIKDLLEQYRTGKINDEELALLEAWYTEWQPDHFKVSHQELETVKGEVWESIVKLPGRAKNNIRLWPAIAAAVLMIGLLSLCYLSYKAMREPEIKQTIVSHTTNDFKPGSNKALLRLSNGKEIILTDAKNGKLADQGTVTVNKKADGQLVYGSSVKNKNLTTEMVYNTMSTPRGGQYHLILSDGTQVWLNAASSITYPVAFLNGERKVTVNGEAYFEVAHNQNKPFKVSSGNQEITVLGTHFNVKGYADDAGISTTLITGSIQIKNLTSGDYRLLSPGQQAKIFKNMDQINISNVNPDLAISWKNGYFLFDNQDIKSVMKIMSRWYDVDVEYRNINKQERFGGTFSRSSNLSEILNNLSLVGKVHFEIQSKKIVVID